nr:putative RNA-directed DNA polymerase [Tanacetum cinerariifolium]
MLWFLDSGCSNHMCGNKNRFVEFDSGFSNSVKLGNNTRMMVNGKGSVKLFLNGATYVINDVYYVPDLKNNLLSIGQLQQKGLSFLFKQDVCKVFHQYKGLIFQSYMSTNRMFPICKELEEVTDQKVDGCMYTSNEDNAKLWHERMGHLSNTSMEVLQVHNMVRDLPSFAIKKSVCEELEVETGKMIKSFRTDRGGEYLSDAFKAFCSHHGVSEESKAYRLIDPQTLKVIVSKDVVFEEHKSWL